MGLIGLVAFLFIGMTFINRMLEGAFVSTGEIEILNDLTIMRSVNPFGLFPIPVPNISFFTSGIPHLLKWDYSFFGGNASLISYFLYVLSIVVTFLLFTYAVGLVSQFLSRSR